MRRGELVSGSLQVSAIKVSVAVLIDRHKGVLCVVKTALYAEKAAELDLPGELH